MKEFCPRSARSALLSGSVRTRTASVALVAVMAGFLFVAGGCESIAGIEDRTLESSSATASSELCRSYCSTIQTNCTGDNQAYLSEQDCLDACGVLPEGQEGDSSGNTVGCRLRQATQAGITAEPDVHCAPAGMLGGDTCGSNCEGYCSLLEASCADDVAALTLGCVEACEGLRDTGTIDREVDGQGDTLQCRSLLAAAAIGSADQCAGAKHDARGGPCADPSDRAGSCADYCKLVTTSCSGVDQVWESEAECLASCGALPVGLVSHAVEDSVGCRTYHAYSALSAPEKHCAHAGLGGDGHCGEDNCAGYCLALQANCGTQFAAAHADVPGCENACRTVSGSSADSGFTTAAADGNTLQCRLLYLARAGADPSACDSAAGAGNCQ